MAATQPATSHFEHPHYTLKRRCGDGTYGDVWEALDTRTERRCAIKRPRKVRERTGVDLAAYRELALLRGLAGHPNVVELLDVFLDAKPTEGACRPINLVLELTAGGDLQQRLRGMHDRGEAFAPEAMRSIARQLVEGVGFLHRNWVLHRDLKPANILLADGDRVKIADFGLARNFQCPLKGLACDGTVVTLWYRAPELLLGAKSYGVGVDNWALGCILGELQRRAPLFLGAEAKPGALQEDQLHHIFLRLGVPRHERWPQGLPHWAAVQRWPGAAYPDADTLPSFLELSAEGGRALLGLLRGLLRFNPAARLTAKDALAHPFFAAAAAGAIAL